MAWRVLDNGNDVWNVAIATERRANSAQWGLVLSFRSAGSNPQRFWAPYPIQATSKAALYAQAETLTDQDLMDVLNAHLGRP
jgi:hypothetical protein